MYSLVSATPIVQSILYFNSYPLVLNVSFNIVLLKMIFFSISYSLLYHLYLPYDLFLNKSAFITINNFLLLAMVNILTILPSLWKIAASFDKWTNINK